MWLILYGSLFLEQVEQYVLPRTVHHTGHHFLRHWSSQSSQSNQPCHPKPPRRNSSTENLLLMQFTSQPDTYWPYVTFINGKITFQQSFELEEGEACIIVCLKQNYPIISVLAGRQEACKCLTRSIKSAHQQKTSANGIEASEWQSKVLSQQTVI